ncbi:MAG: AlpA family phage regulatory protein, partial [Shewanella sp.]
MNALSNPVGITVTDRLVREAERKKITSISRTTAWSLERKGLFPKRRQLYPQSTSVGW